MENITVDIIISGNSYTLTTNDVIRKAASFKPDPISIYYCKLANKQYPPKQIVSIATGLGKSEFTTATAINILKRLGIEIFNKNE